MTYDLPFRLFFWHGKHPKIDKREGDIEPQHAPYTKRLKPHTPCRCIDNRCLYGPSDKEQAERYQKGSVVRKK